MLMASTQSNNATSLILPLYICIYLCKSFIPAQHESCARTTFHSRHRRGKHAQQHLNNPHHRRVHTITNKQVRVELSYLRRIVCGLCSGCVRKCAFDRTRCTHAGRVCAQYARTVRIWSRRQNEVQVRCALARRSAFISIHGAPRTKWLTPLYIY